MTRRVVLLVAGSAGGASLAGCAGSASHGTPPSTPGPSTPAKATSSAPPNVDSALRASAISDERRLLAACAAPKGQEPFETLSAIHLARLRALMGHPVQRPPAVAAAPAPAGLIAVERRAVAARRADCLRASADLAPLLASLAAGGNVALTLLARAVPAQ